MMSFARVVLVLAVAVGALTTFSAASAQTDQVALIEAENASLGPGCNPIALAVEGPTAPVAPSAEWIEEHTACGIDGTRAGAQCQGGLSGDYRYEICAIIFTEAGSQQPMSCANMSLVTTTHVVGADEQMTAEAVDYYRQTLIDANLGAAAESLVSCVDSPVSKDNMAVMAAFAVPRTEEHVVFRTRVGPDIAQQVAFIVTDQRIEAP